MTNSIKIKLKINGQGVVNFDGKEQKYFMNEHCGTKYYGDNVKIAKKTFQFVDNINEVDAEYIDEDGNVKDKGKKKKVDVESHLKISSNCLRHHIFGNTYPNALALYSDYIFANFITSPQNMVRGYMETEEGMAYVKKSALTITDAIEQNGVVPYLELNSREIKKEKNSNSLFYTENVGNVSYLAKGNIDLKTLQFMSDDELFGRVSFKPKWLEGENPLLEKVFKNHYGYIPYKEGYFTSTKGVLTERFAEHGIKFNDDFVKFLVKDTLKRILHFGIFNANAFAQTVSLKVKKVENGVLDTFDDENGWEDLTSDEAIDKFDFSINDFFEEVDAETAKMTRKELVEAKEKAETEAKKDKKVTKDKE